MLTINSSQINFSAECRDEQTGITFAIFDASYGPGQTYFGISILQDDPQILSDFAEFKERIMTTKEEFGIVDLVDNIEEEEPIEDTPVEE